MKMTIFGILVGMIAVLSCQQRQNDSQLQEVVAGTSKAARTWQESNSLFSGTFNTMTIEIDHQTFQKVTSLQSVNFTHPETGKKTNGDACKEAARYGRIKKIKFFNHELNQEVVLKGGGIRVKGNTSCANFDKQFKIKLTTAKTFEGYGKESEYSKKDKKQLKKNSLFGIKEFALRDSNNDPSKLREPLASRTFAFGGELARAFGISGAPRFGGPVYRSGFVEVKFRFTGNGQGKNNFSKIYLMSELVNEEFLAMRYGKKAIGHLFKSSHNDNGPAFLMKNYQSEHQDDAFNKSLSAKLAAVYASDTKLNSIYQAKIVNGDDAEDAKESARIIRQLIDRIDKATTKDELIKFVDIGNVLSYLAAVNLSGHWDSLVTNGNNDYLFFNTSFKDGEVFGSKGLRGKWQIITWDLDNSFGSLATNGGPHDPVWFKDIYTFNKGKTISKGDRALFAKILWLWRDAYRERIGHFIYGYQNRRGEFIRGGFEKDRVNERMIAMRNALLKKIGAGGPLNDGSSEFDEKFEILFRWKNQRWDIAAENIK